MRDKHARHLSSSIIYKSTFITLDLKHIVQSVVGSLNSQHIGPDFLVEFLHRILGIC